MNPAKPELLGTPRARPAAPAFSWRDTLLSIWESEGVLSSRLISAQLVTLFTLALQFWALRTAGLTKEKIELVEHLVDADFIYAGSLFGIGVGKIIASRFSPKPTVDLTQQQAAKNDAATSPQA